MGFEWECDEEGDLGSKCEPVELFMIQGEKEGVVYIQYFSLNVFLCVGGRDTKFQWGKI